jgi:hypothetical protein
MLKIHTIFEHPTEDGRYVPLGIDDKGSLYWDGTQVLTKQVVTLDKWVSFAIIVTGAATFAIAAVSIVSLCIDLNLLGGV